MVVECEGVVSWGGGLAAGQRSMKEGRQWGNQHIKRRLTKTTTATAAADVGEYAGACRVCLCAMWWPA